MQYLVMFEDDLVPIQRFNAITVTLTLFAILGCSSDKPQKMSFPLGVTMPSEAMNALQAGTEFSLLSLDPSDLFTPNPDGFHNFDVLGSTFPSQPDREQLVKSFAAGVTAHDGMVAACFDPRHGIRVQYEGKCYDFVICFECAKIYWYTDSEKNETILTSGTPKQVFDKVLTKASIKLAEPY